MQSCVINLGYKRRYIVLILLERIAGTVVSVNSLYNVLVVTCVCSCQRSRFQMRAGLDSVRAIMLLLPQSDDNITLSTQHYWQRRVVDNIKPCFNGGRVAGVVNRSNSHNAPFCCKHHVFELAAAL
jgi:hypothetical protein